MADTPKWHLKTDPREWQAVALAKWLQSYQGVVSVVTGGGTTIFAFLCMDAFNQEHPDGRYIILVPTITLLDQWYVSLQEDFGVPDIDIACFSSQEKSSKPSKINLMVINTGRSMVSRLIQDQPSFLIVDECHRAGSPENAKALKGIFSAALGLSATPEREYDEGFQKYVVPALGPSFLNMTMSRLSGMRSSRRLTSLTSKSIFCPTRRRNTTNSQGARLCCSTSRSPTPKRR